MYDGHPNQGMRCLLDVVAGVNAGLAGQTLEWEVFDVRQRAELPGLDHDVFLSSGGPGGPFDGDGTTWEKRYFEWLAAVLAHNRSRDGSPKFVCAICYSFELVARFSGCARVTRRRSTSFGVMPIHLTAAGRQDPLFRGLSDPFYGLDFRDWQVVQPDRWVLDALGGSVLALEKPRPHVPLERSVMALRLSPEVVGLQFHPEADLEGVRRVYVDPERQAWVLRRRGQAKVDEIAARVEDPRYLEPTHRTVLPSFLRDAVARL